MVEDVPLVSVVCLCYNQGRWVEEAIESVLRQTYPNIEIILADDASTDGSQEIIQRISEKYPQIKIFLSPFNRGNCTAFNEAFRATRGEFVVDFAADDVMMPERIEKQVRHFSGLDENYGVIITDAHYIDEDGKYIRGHYEWLRKKGLLKTVPQGNVYRDVLSRFFIAAPTMLVRRAVLERLGGYDETLYYEDFDFWVRSSREFRYAYIDEPLTLIRRSRKSMSTRWYKRGDRMLHSTYLVCRKAMALNRDEGDRAALIDRARYEFRQAVLSDNRHEARLFENVLKDLGATTTADRFISLINRTRLPMRPIRNAYHWIRYGKV